MKSVRLFGFFFLVLLSLRVNAATSSMLFRSQAPLGSNTVVRGLPGNLKFNGEQFVTPVVESNGIIYLAFVASNGVVISNFTSLSLTGSSPRLLVDGDDYLLTWLDTNASPNVLMAARIAGGVTSASSILATNVEEESIALSVAQGEVLAVWQSQGSNSSVYGRPINLLGAPLAESFAISTSALPQRYPSVDNDGTNHLVCWMEQNSGSNDWHVLAQLVSAGNLSGAAVEVSEANSMHPYKTACSFGTNFLAAWSADGDSYVDPFVFPYVTNWHQSVHLRFLSIDGIPHGGQFTTLRNPHHNTNVSVVFGGGQYLVACLSSGVKAPSSSAGPPARQRVQLLAPDGTMLQHPFDAAPGDFARLSPRLAFGGGQFVVLYPDYRSNSAVSVAFDYARIPDFAIVNLFRTNNGIAAGWTGILNPGLEVSTNLVHWVPRPIQELSYLSGGPRLFVRLADQKWQCAANRRAIDWAKLSWAHDNWMFHWHTPMDSNLFGPGAYLPQKPVCPQGGFYQFRAVSERPACTLSDHDSD